MLRKNVYARFICQSILVLPLFTLTSLCAFELYAQPAKPITKNNLLRALERGKTHPQELPFDRLIELLKRRGVSFQLKPADERLIRQAGVYLGAERLDVLLTTVRDSYRPRAVPAEAKRGQVMSDAPHRPTSPEVAHLVGDLAGADARGRMNAADALGKMGAEAKDATPALTRALQDKEPGVRVKAAHALRQIKPTSKDVITGLIIALKDEGNASLRAASAQALQAIGPAAKEAKPALIIALSDSSAYTRSYAATALWEIDKSSRAEIVQTLVGIIRQDRLQEREARYVALDALALIGAAAEDAVPTLVQLAEGSIYLRDEYGALLKDEEKFRLQAKSFIALKNIGDVGRAGLSEVLRKKGYGTSDFIAAWLTADPSAEAVRAVIVGVDGPRLDWYTRHLIGKAIATVGPAAVPVLKDAVKKPENIWIVEPLIKLDPTFKNSAVSILAAAFASPDLQIWKQAVSILAELGPAAGEATPALVKALESGDSGVSGAALKAVATIGPAAKAAIPALMRIAETGNTDVRCEAVRAIGKVGGNNAEAVSFLIKTIESQDHCVAITALRTLREQGVPPREALPALIRIVSNLKQEASLRNSAFQAIGAMGHNAEAAVPALISLIGDSNSWEPLSKIGLPAVPLLIQKLSDKNSWTRSIVMDILAKMGPVAKDAIPAITSRLKNNEDAATAAKALGEIGPAAKDAVPSLIVALSHKSGEVRMQAAQALGRIGRDARTAIPALTLTLNDKDYRIREAASEAISRIQSGDQ